MASISKQPNGRKTIQFVGPDGKRRSIRLGKVSLRTAEAVKVRVEQLAAAAISGHAVDDETARWLSKIDSVMAGKLVRVGLILQRESATLREFIDNYINSRVDVKPNTIKSWRQTLRHLTNYLSPDKPLRDITRGDAKDWRLELIGREMADASIRKHCGFAKHFFAQAVDKELIGRNPFASLPSASVANLERQYFVSRDEIRKVFEACPDAEWRLIVALSRFGGLRTPSEAMLLRLEDIHWDSQRFAVRSPKTERHAGHESRIVPLFPELAPFLEAVFDEARPGAVHVIEQHRIAAGNLRTQMMRIVRRAGLKTWPRIFHNMRSSRQTELEEQFPTHVVCKWIDNSALIAHKHYLQVRETDFEKAVRNPVQQPAVSRRIGSHDEFTTRQDDSGAHEKAPVLQGAAGGNEGVRSSRDDARFAPTGVDGNRTHPATFQPPHWV